MGLLTFPGKYFESHDKLLEDYELEMIPSQHSKTVTISKAWNKQNWKHLRKPWKFEPCIKIFSSRLWKTFSNVLGILSRWVKMTIKFQTYSSAFSHSIENKNLILSEKCRRSCLDKNVHLKALHINDNYLRLTDF